GAVISEAAPGAVVTDKGRFLQRNRIVSALSRAVVVVEAGERSGTLNTARHARDQGRERFVVPGGVDLERSRGTNGLLAEGNCRVARNANDVLFWCFGELFEQRPARNDLPPLVAPELAGVLALIPIDPIPIAVLASRAAMPPGPLLV